MTSSSAPTVQLAAGRHLLQVVAVERIDDSLALEVTVRVRRSSTSTACDVPVDDLTAWRDALRQVFETLSGAARLETPGLRVRVEGNGTGHLTVEGEVSDDLPWGDGARAVLRFALPVLDQSHLPPVLAALDRALALEPDPEP